MFLFIYVVMWCLNPLPEMPILGSSTLAADKDIMPKILKNGDTITCIWLSWKHCGKRRNCSFWAISPFPTMFSKAVCCWCVKMSIYGVKDYICCNQLYLFPPGMFSILLKNNVLIHVGFVECTSLWVWQVWNLTLSQSTTFRHFQTERVCRQKFQVYWKWQKALQTGWKHCGKRRNCSLQAISPFPTTFSKDLYCRHVKTRACLGKG